MIIKNDLAFVGIIRNLAETVEACVSEIQRLRSAIHDDPKLQERYMAAAGVRDAESHFASIHTLRQRVDSIYQQMRDDKS